MGRIFFLNAAFLLNYLLPILFKCVSIYLTFFNKSEDSTKYKNLFYKWLFPSGKNWQKWE